MERDRLIEQDKRVGTDEMIKQKERINKNLKTQA